MRMMLDACKRGVAAVVVTHDAQLASWADRVVFLRDGHIVDQTVPPPARSRCSQPGADAMSTTLLERPAAAAPRPRGDGGVPARRAVIRWAWRLFRREWRQQLLVLALITVAVAATIIGAAVATNNPPPANCGLRHGPGPGRVPGSRPAPGQPDRVAASTASAASTSSRTRRFGVPGSINTYELRAQNPHGPFGQPMLSLVSGHFPAGAGPGRRDQRGGLRLQPACRRRVAPGRHRPGRWSASSRTRRACSTSSPSWSPARSAPRPRSPSCSTRRGVRPRSLGPNVSTADRRSRQQRDQPRDHLAWPRSRSGCCSSPWSRSAASRCWPSAGCARSACSPRSAPPTGTSASWCGRTASSSASSAR